jgi:hypothetical protein
VRFWPPARKADWGIPPSIIARRSQRQGYASSATGHHFSLFWRDAAHEWHHYGRDEAGCDHETGVDKNLNLRFSVGRFHKLLSAAVWPAIGLQKRQSSPQAEEGNCGTPPCDSRNICFRRSIRRFGSARKPVAAALRRRANDRFGGWRFGWDCPAQMNLPPLLKRSEPQVESRDQAYI